MILDNLSIAGLVVASLFLFLPLLFGKEFWRVDEARTAACSVQATADESWDTGPEAAPCAEG
jgi:4-amino-4-deoxy-L-arabinose transferase-like glycosyltransferase